MKKISRVLVAAIAVMMMALIPMSVSAAGINEYEQAILDKAASYVGSLTMTDGQSVKAQSLLAQAQAYFAKDDVELTKAEASKVEASVDSAYAKLPSKDTTKLSLTDMYNSQGIASDVSSIAKTLGVTISVDAPGAAVSIVKSGEKIGGDSSIIKATGTTEATAIIAAVLLFSVLGCAVIAKKNRIAED